MTRLRRDIKYPVLVMSPFGHRLAHDEAELVVCLHKAERECKWAWWGLIALAAFFSFLNLYSFFLVKP